MATEGTFSAKPFVSKDGKDANGHRAEVKVVVGFGDVSNIETSSAGKSHKTSFAVANTKYQSSGWSRDERIMSKVREAQESNTPLHFRIETRRKDGIDRETPINELTNLASAKDSIVKSLAAVKLDSDSDWTISQDAVTRLDEDPVTGGLYSAYNDAPEERQAPSRAAAAHSAKTVEPAPYIGRLSSGEVNPGGAGLNSLLGFFNYILEFEREEGVAFEKEKRKDIALIMLKLANKLQHDIYQKKLGVEPVGVDITHASHVRARALIFEAVRSFAPLHEELGTDEDALKKWQKTVYMTSYAMWEWAIDELDEYIN